MLLSNSFICVRFQFDMLALAKLRKQDVRVESPGHTGRLNGIVVSVNTAIGGLRFQLLSSYVQYLVSCAFYVQREHQSAFRAPL